ncbi:MAG: hypothetical protein HC797_08585 [Anaerolineales bacterium]|nr:hypothetical protein [Anaerolineales bacterium]
MEILGIGMPELIFIVIIILIVLGPKDMQKTGKTIGRWLRDLTRSEGWKVFQQTSRELRTLPTKLIRDANNEFNEIGKDIKSASNLTPNRDANPKQTRQPQPFSEKPMTQPDNKISPPTPEPEPKESESEQANNA